MKPEPKTLLFSYERECAIVFIQDGQYRIYKFIDPFFTRFDVAAQNDVSVVRLLCGDTIVKQHSWDNTTDFTLWGTTKNLQVITGTGDWRSAIGLSERYTIKELFKMINIKLESERP
jgi:hypothetical protein